MRHRLGVVVLLLVGALAAPVAAQSGRAYAPLNREGPALSVTPAQVRAALECRGNASLTRKRPVLLVPGTNLEPRANFSWNYARAFAADRRAYCMLELPDWALGDIQVAGEYVVGAIRLMAARERGRIDVVGYSQGGMVPRWALRFWPDTREMVDDLVGLAPSNHGTVTAEAACQGSCPPAHWQQRSSAAFIEALNSRAETFAGIDYTVVYTHLDQIVVPNLDESGSSSLRTGKGTVANIATQDVCPSDTTDHLAMGSYSAVAYALAVDALDHRGPAKADRVPVTTCAQPFGPGVAPETFAGDYAGLLSTIAQSSAEGPRVDAEPELARYVFR